MSNAYSPEVVEGESANGLWFERAIFDGQHLAAVAYGLHLAIFGITAYFLVCRPAKGKILWPFILFVFLLLACGTINIASGIKVAEMTWIDDRDIPGGPSAFNTVMYSSMIETLGNAAYITANFLADGILIWRCFVVYNHNYWVMIIPTMAFMTSTALSILTLYQAARPMASLWSKSAVVVAIPYWSLSIGLNIFVSMMIVCRLLWHRHIIAKSLGPRNGAIYASIAAMFIESAALYAITGLVYIICFARNSNVQHLVLGVLGQVECIAPELIILRVALGRAWSTDTSNANTSTKMTFASHQLTGRRGHGAMVSMFVDSHFSQSGGLDTQAVSSGSGESSTDAQVEFGISKPDMTV